jgi:uncharacterized protein YkwD
MGDSSTRAPAHRIIASGLLGVALLVGGLALPRSAAASESSQFVAVANVYRASVGAAPVVSVPILEAITAERAEQMARADELTHDLTYVTNRLSAAGVCIEGLGEIIAWERGYSSQSYQRTVDSWWNSSPHRAVMTKPQHNAAGGAWTTARDGGIYSVMVFVDLCTAPSGTTFSVLVGARELDPARRVVLLAGTHTGYRFDDAGAVAATKRYDLPRASGASTSMRALIGGRPYLRIVDGIWAGYWIPESGRAYVKGFLFRKTYDPLQPLGFAAGTYTGYRYDRNGNILGRKTFTLSRGSGAPAEARALINGRWRFLVADGVWDGYWIEDAAGVWPK